MLVLEVKKSCNEKEIEVLFREYAKIKGAEACFVSFENELKNLDNAYTGGMLAVAYEDGKPVGCGALRKISDDECEMKRIFVKEICRGKGYGKKIVEFLIEQAGVLGFSKIQLSTIPNVMGAAYKMYKHFDFCEYESKDGIVYMRLNLKTVN